MSLSPPIAVAAKCTPVWMALRVGRGTSSAARAGKVKRVRANGRAALATCTARGVVTGPDAPVAARIVDDATTVAAAYLALRAKYGWQMWLTDCLSKLVGRYEQRAIIELGPP